MNCSTQTLYRKNEVEYLLGELVIADLAIPGDPRAILDMLYQLGSVLEDQGRHRNAEDVALRLVEGHRSRLGNSSDDVEMMTALDLLRSTLSCQELYIRAENLSRRTLEGKSVYLHKYSSTTLVLSILGN